MSVPGSHCFYEGRVVHQRHGDLSHRLSYRVISAFLNIGELESLKTPLFSVNRFNLFSFYESDHMDEGFENLEDFVSHLLISNGEIHQPGNIMVLAYPRFLGHAFNPLTIFFCHDEQEMLRTIIYQVRNTFGQRHHYLVRTNGRQKTQKHACEKQLYVSPFIEMDCTYSFVTRSPDERASVVIKQYRNGKPILTASFIGRCMSIGNLALLSLAVRYFQTGSKVLGSIHWEALKLWLKGAVLQPRPQPPQKPVTIMNECTHQAGD